MRRSSLAAITLSLCGTLSLACGDTTGEDDGGTDGGNDGGGQSDAKDGGAADMTPDAAPAPKFMYIVIYDDAKPACTTTGPGTDVDAVELSRGGSVVGVGKTGSAIYTPGPLPTGKAAPDDMTVPCGTDKCGSTGDKPCKYADASLKANTEGVADGEVKAVGDDVGYMSLNAGALAIQIGNATGGGDAQEIKTGDKLRIYEVDLFYKSRSSMSPPKAYSGCTCTPDKYEVYISPTLDPVMFATEAKKLTASKYETANDTCTTLADGCGTTDFTVPTL